MHCHQQRLLRTLLEYSLRISAFKRLMTSHPILLGVSAQMDGVGVSMSDSQPQLHSHHSLGSVPDLGRSAAPSSASQSSSSIPQPIPGGVKPSPSSSASTFYNTKDICPFSKSLKPRGLDHSKVATIRTWPSCELIINVRTFLDMAGPDWHHAQLNQGMFIHF